MKFSRMSDWHELSDNGCYTVSGARVKDGFKFQAWLLAPQNGKTSELLGTFDTADDARKCCEQHEDTTREMA